MSRMALQALLALLGLASASASASGLGQTALEEPDHVPGLGTVRGSRTVSHWKRRPIYQYQAIPYAEPPSGARRFLPPEPAKPWQGVLDATALGRRCPQEWELPPGPPGQQQGAAAHPGDEEDCLTLNVYTPARPRQCGRLLPVMFYIHGGSWRVGSAKDFKPHYLLDEDVLLVVIQYRLGPLGFLSLQSDSVPGNAGLLDQLLALKWVNQYIRHFCGDPDNVTIFGSSAGAASVTLFMISPLVGSELFRRVIFQSGAARCTWIIDDRPVTNARNIAYYANCTSTDLDKLTACLRAVSPQTLLAAHNQYLDLAAGGRASGAGGNHAVVQKAGAQRFLVEHPLHSLRHGRHKRLPVMGGVTKNEGSLFLWNIYDIFLEPKGKVFDADYLRHNVTKVTLEFSGIDDDTGALSDVFRERYFKDRELGNFSLMTPGLIDICGVALLKACTFRMVQENSRLAPSYLYSFNYKGRHSKFGYGYTVEYPFAGGVAHSDDLIYLFPDSDLNEEDDSTARTMVDLWTNFATYGEPTPRASPAHRVSDWPPVSTEHGPYLRVDRTPHVRDNFLDEYNIAVAEASASTGTCLAVASTSTAVACAVVLLLFRERPLPSPFT